jgi:hypothetical protein
MSQHPPRGFPARLARLALFPSNGQEWSPCFPTSSPPTSLPASRSSRSRLAASRSATRAPATGESGTATAAQPAAPAQAPESGQVPQDWRPGTGTIITGAAADKAKAAALDAGYSGDGQPSAEAERRLVRGPYVRHQRPAQRLRQHRLQRHRHGVGPSGAGCCTSRRVSPNPVSARSVGRPGRG